MKNKILSFLLLLFVFSTGSKAQTNQVLPELNQSIINYVQTVIDKKVDRGECWDLANQALNRAGAKWKFPTQFGVELNPKMDTILPGDIIQFKNVKMGDSKGQTWSFSTHTAIVYKVIAKGVYQVAEQNVNGIRKVKIDDLNYNNLKSGKMIFYRPTK